MNKLNIPEFKEKKELFDFLIENKATLEAQKKAETKHADSFSYSLHYFDKQTKSFKAEPNNEPENGEELKVRVVINTTKILDSHFDVHIDGLWKKSLSENKNILFLQEHEMKFDKIISDQSEIKAFVQNYTWNQLGFDYQGSTQALVFDATINKSRNEFMFKQYAKGFVKNHSVGMRYVQIVMAIDNPDYGAEFEAWEKYYPMIVNQEDADNRGYFWAVKEAKIIEGSAVLLGSNIATPTISVSAKLEPPIGTQKAIKEPSYEDTLKYLVQNY